MTQFSISRMWGGDKEAKDQIKAKLKSCLNSSGIKWPKFESRMWIDFNSGIADVILSAMCI